jgi:hypothetical protein
VPPPQLYRVPIQRMAALTASIAGPVPTSETPVVAVSSVTHGFSARLAPL